MPRQLVAYMVTFGTWFLSLKVFLSTSSIIYLECYAENKWKKWNKMLCTIGIIIRPIVLVN